jgi:hypothetical protein
MLAIGVSMRVATRFVLLSRLALVLRTRTIPVAIPIAITIAATVIAAVPIATAGLPVATFTAITTAMGVTWRARLFGARLGRRRRRASPAEEEAP